jgi:hypothetical protein
MRIVLAVLALALPASAAAKGPDSASVCGATRCVAVRGEIPVYSLLDWKATPFMQLGAPTPAPYYPIMLRGWGMILYLPARELIRIDDPESPPYWRSLPEYQHARYAKLVRGLAPRPAPARWP